MAVKRALSEAPSEERHNQKLGTGAYIFYPAKAAHLSQSDFGILFPRLTRLAVKAEEPERIVRLNIRAILEVMRSNGVRVANTSLEDLELSASNGVMNESTEALHDEAILMADGSIRGWISLSLGQEDHSQEGVDKETSAAVNPEEAAVEGKM